MSDSNRTISIPNLTIPERWQKALKRQSVLALNLVDLVTAFDNMIDNLLSSTEASNPKVAALWAKAATYIAAARDTWVVPLRKQIGRYLTRLDRQKRLDGAPATRFLDGTKVTLTTIEELLDGCLASFSNKMEMWQRSYPFLTDLLPTQTTMRTLPEIMMEAILISGKNWSTAGNETIGSWIGSLKDLQPAVPFSNPLQTGSLSLSSAAWKRIYNLKPERTGLGVGSVACVCALWTGTTLLTGSTLYKRGDALSGAETVNGFQRPGFSDLHRWNMDLRQARFTSAEQGLLNTLVERRSIIMATGWRSY